MKLDSLLTSIDTPSHEAISNLQKLLVSLNKFESLIGTTLIVTSGWRSWNDHKRIYGKLNEKRKLLGKPVVPIPLHSAHLSGNAADLNDPYGVLKVVVMENIGFCKNLGAHFEDFDYTDGWVHWQQIPPASGKFFFIP